MGKQMNCNPLCPYFPNSESSIDWEYDQKIPYLKRRKNQKNFICGYDGHIITSWYEDCPKNKAEKI